MRAALRLLTLVAFGAAPVACLSSASPPGADDGGPAAAAPTQDATVPNGDAGDLATVSIARDGGSPISPYAFGQNYWDWVDFTGSGTTGLTGTEPTAAGLHLNVIRAGGNNNDTNSPMPFDAAQIDTFVSYCRSVGAQPILQVPLLANNIDAGAASAQAAADMVTYANGTKGYGIKYWEIGNEPDLYSRMYDAGTAPQTAADYCTRFKEYVTAMKAANAAAGDGGTPIQFLGPELSYQYGPGGDWLTPFLDGCKDYVDIVTIHRYPFSATTTSISGALTGAASFQSILRSVGTIVKGHARPNAFLAVTEANISYDYMQSAYTQTSIQAAPGSFYAALWTADVMGVALENDLWTLALWNIGETSVSSSVLGFIVADQPAPAYYSEQMISANFSGNALAPTGVPAGFSVYASYDGSKKSTAVLVLNKTATAGALALAIDALAPQSFDFPATSVNLVQIADDPASSPHVLQYTADLAAAKMPPRTVE
jgi:hypothetical protein